MSFLLLAIIDLIQQQFTLYWVLENRLREPTLMYLGIFHLDTLHFKV